MSSSKTWQLTLLRKQRGLSLATAIFVITVMALLASLIFQLVRSNAQSTAEEVNLIRAFYAAESGAQFGLNRAFQPNGGTSCPATTTYNFVEGDFNGCRAEVSCDNSIVVNSVTHYTITSAGSCGDLTRTIQVRAR